MDAFPRNDVVLFVGDAPGITQTVAAAFAEENIHIRQIHWMGSGCAPGSDQILVLPAEQTDVWRQKICPQGERVGAIVNFSGFSGEPGKAADVRHSLFGFFNLIKMFETDLRASGKAGGGKIAVITPMGGQFGLTGRQDFLPEAAGAAGIAKSVGLEWPDVHVRVMDIDPTLEADRIAAQLVQEIFVTEKAGEIGLDRNGRWKLALEEQPTPYESPGIDPESVLLILGGALGVTAEVAKAAAEKYHPKMVIVGRSSLPDPEPEDTRHLEEIGALRSYFIHQARETNGPSTPTAINQKINRLMKQRQLARNIQAMENWGASVEYVSLDVRNGAGLSALIHDIYERYGRIDGVIHGAGVIDDRRIRDKNLESFKTVWDTKVIPARILMEQLRPDTLKFMVFFSSIAARFGNVGQSDYAAANEALNKYAHRLRRKWKDTRVVSIGWGPWETGMVTEDLKKFYQKNNINLIPVEKGVQFFFNEIGAKADAPAEIVAAPDINRIADKGLGRVF